MLLHFDGCPNWQEFADPSAPVGLACRVYRTTTGLAGAPSVDELTAVLRVAG